MVRSGVRRLRVEPLEQRQLLSVTAATYDPAMPDLPGLIDDGSAAFEQTGTGWNSVSGAMAWQGDFQYHTPGDGSNTARWTLDDLTPGAEYRVYASWSAHPFGSSATALQNLDGPDRDLLASNARYTLDDGAAMHSEVHVDQRTTHAWATGAVIGPLPRPTVHGPYWQPLGTFRVETGTLTVELSDAADGIVIADAVRVQQVTEVPPLWIANDTAPLGVDLTDTAQTDTNLTATPTAATGDWQTVTAASADEGTFQYLLPGDQAGSFTWTFDDLEPGRQYVVLVSWPSHADGTDRSIFAQQAAYTIRDGVGLRETVYLDQQQATRSTRPARTGTTWARTPSAATGWWSNFSRTRKASSWPMPWPSSRSRMRPKPRRRRPRRQAHCPQSSLRRPWLRRPRRAVVAA